MTISSTSNRISYTGNGSSTSFSFPYYFQSLTDLVVLKVLISTNAETTLVYSTDYTITGTKTNNVYASGGQVVLVTAPTSDYKIVIYRSPTLTQTIDLVENDALPAETLEQGFDKLTMITQRLNDLVDRSFTLPDGFSSTFDTTLPSDINTPGALLITNEAGTGFIIGPDLGDLEAASANAAIAAAAAASLGPAATSIPFQNVVTLTSNTSLDASSNATIYNVDCTSGSKVITLPALSLMSLGNSVNIVIKKYDTTTNTVTINRAASDTIDNGLTSKMLMGQNEALLFAGDGTNWTTLGFLDTTIDTFTARNITFADAPILAEIATPSTPASGYGKIYFKADNFLYQMDDAGVERKVGTSTGVDTVFALTADENISDWTTGKNATFLGAGTIAGTFAKETTSPLNGTASYKYTQAGGSLTDYVVSSAQQVPLKFRGKTVYMAVAYSYDGANNDIAAVIYDSTNLAVISSSTDLLSATTSNGTTAIVAVSIPSTCQTVRVGFHVKALNSGKILIFDDIKFSTELFSITSIANLGDWTAYTPTFTGMGTVTSVSVYWRRVGQDMEVMGSCTAGTVTGTQQSITMPTGYVLATGALSIPANTTSNPGNSVGFYAQSATNVHGRLVTAPGTSTSIIYLGGNAGSTTFATPSLNSLASSIPFVFNFKVPVLGWDNYSSAVTIPNSLVTSESMVFAFKSTAINTDTDPIGTFNTYLKAVSSATSGTINASAPTQTVANMSSQGILVTFANYATATTAALPSRFDILLPKNLKGFALYAYSGTSKSGNPLVIDVSNVGTTHSGLQWIYNEKTGMLNIDGTAMSGSGITTRNMYTYDYTASATTVYIYFNASPYPVVSSLPVLVPRIATIKDVKATNTGGGATGTGGIFTARTLQTLDDPFGIVTTLSANRFTLPSGRYFVTASAQAYRVASHQIQIYNVTDAASQIVGANGYNDSATSVTVDTCYLMGYITITSAKQFELQHYVQTANGTASGLGIAANSGVSNIYGQVQITKVQ